MTLPCFFFTFAFAYSNGNYDDRDFGDDHETQRRVDQITGISGPIVCCHLDITYCVHDYCREGHDDKNNDNYDHDLSLIS